MILFIENTIKTIVLVFLCIIFSFLKLSNLRVDHVIFVSLKNHNIGVIVVKKLLVLSVGFGFG
uniref:Uncharacterized protein n=1 Tax=Rhizophagus irregularis (strain DAOM 181602 / DAOM 197198 / MUCL 43194) TaxID=747089 RepID=U9TZ65_RHIID